MQRPPDGYLPYTIQFRNGATPPHEFPDSYATRELAMAAARKFASTAHPSSTYTVCCDGKIVTAFCGEG